jgi:hypothetical protein
VIHLHLTQKAGFEDEALLLDSSIASSGVDIANSTFRNGLVATRFDRIT